MIKKALKTRRLAKFARELLHHAAHLRHMREDLMSPQNLQILDTAVRDLETALKARDWQSVEKTTEPLVKCINALTPNRTHPGIRENVEIAVVAIAVAMAFRTYFLQPFKIPTGSMQPTLYGIIIKPDARPTVMDRLPLKVAKWLVTGDWYTEIKAPISGYVAADQMMGRRGDPSEITFYVGARLVKVPSLTGFRVRPGDLVAEGQVIWSGVHTAGDHLLVNKVIWNFRHPRRGEIMVFNTDRIPTLPANTHYIKRLSALPGETISIDPPFLKINGEKVMSPPQVARIANREPGYAGYQLVDPRAWGSASCFLRTPDDSVKLGEGEFFALGDNTGNSRDSRYWGTVKQSNMVGPALAVYWPFSKRWGLAD